MITCLTKHCALCSKDIAILFISRWKHGIILWSCSFNSPPAFPNLKAPLSDMDRDHVCLPAPVTSYENRKWWGKAYGTLLGLLVKLLKQIISWVWIWLVSLGFLLWDAFNKEHGFCTCVPVWSVSPGQELVKHHSGKRSCFKPGILWSHLGVCMSAKVLGPETWS